MQEPEDKDRARSGVDGYDGRRSASEVQIEREPVFNMPGIVVWFAALLIAIHAARTYLLDREWDFWVLYAFSFIPARYGDLASQLPFPAAAWWSPVTYAFLHGDWIHLSLNLLWMAAFGTPLARRVGPVRFVVISLICAIGGAVFHYAFHIGEMVPVIGASAIVSGYMGAAARFAFQSGPTGMLTADGPAMTLIQSFTNRSFLIFAGVWFAINFLFGSGAIPIAGEDVSIAWQAHVGGFVAGLLCFSWLDDPGRRSGRTRA